MGYDFMLEKAKITGDIVFPCSYEHIEIIESSFPLDDLKAHIILKGAKEQDFSQLGSDILNYVWKIPGKGVMYISGTSSYVSLDMHAEWSVVLDLLIWLRELDPEVVLADTNTGDYHDAESFRQFMIDQNTS